MKILFTGGGTAGHISPIIAISREMRRIWMASSKDKLRIYYIGPEDDFGNILLSQEGIKIKNIMAGKIRRYWGIKGSLLNIIDILFKIPIGIFQSFFYIFFLAPDLIFSKGGYGSIPAVIAGFLLQTPIILHESDVSPGLANRIVSRFASEIFISFSVKETEYFSPKKVISVGNPIRKELLNGSKEEAKKIFDLSGERPVVLILGGSQGATRINDLILNILPEILKNFELIHQCGEKNFKQVKAESEVVTTESNRQYYHPFAFLKEEEMRNAFAACNIVISRAGSGSIFEIAAAGKPSILIPLPEAAQNHQIKNAYAYAKHGGCIVIEESNLTPHFFLGELQYLFNQPNILKEMSKSAKEWSRPRAAEIIAEYIIGFLIK